MSLVIEIEKLGPAGKCTAFFYASHPFIDEVH